MTKRVEKQKARDLRVAGHTIVEISEILNCSKNSINKWVKDIILSNEDYYRINSRQAKHSYNVELFRNSNGIIYYLLGSFISDGCVDKNLRKISISSKDEDWLLSIAKVLCPEKLPRKIKMSNCYVLEIHNKQIVNWFTNNECVPRKSLIVKMPTIPNEYLSHFIRGLFDGDGSITITKQPFGITKQLRIYIVSASKTFVEELSKTFDANRLDHKITTISGKNRSILGRELKDYNDCYRIIFTGSKAVKFCEFIYHSKNIYLDRKYQIYQKYLDIRKWELENCMIRQQFDNPENILELLKTHTYKEISNMYGITRKTIIDRLKKYNLYDAAKQIKSTS
jgi:intein/homing endonuclease